MIESKRMRWKRHAAYMGKILVRTTHIILVGKSEGKKALGRYRHRWEDIKMGLKETGCEDVDWTQLVRDGVQ
jgi:hypothetical protein